MHHDQPAGDESRLARQRCEGLSRREPQLIATPEPPRSATPFRDAEDVAAQLATVGYFADDTTATAIHLMTALERPLLVEGPPGVGKTSLARCLAQVSQRPLVRLQCHEGIDDARALYEWDYTRQLLATQLARADPTGQTGQADSGGTGSSVSLGALFDESFLLERPLLTAIRSPEPVVLLIDEVDRADEAFDALLLEVLDEQQVTIPELGTITATSTPWVVLTSNETREVADALKRRCLRIAVDYPTPERELEIVTNAVPGVAAALAQRVVEALASLRSVALHQPPGSAEAIEWARALLVLGADDLDERTIEQTLATIVKHSRDEAAVRNVLIPDAPRPDR